MSDDKRCSHGFLRGLCVINICPHFDGAGDWKARLKTRFSHAKGDGRVIRATRVTQKGGGR